MSSTLIFIILVLCLLLKPNRVEPVHHDGSIADAPKLDDHKSSVSDGIRAPQLKLDDHDASLPLAGCALLEHDAEASSALKRELHHDSSRAVAARSSKRATKRAKLALSQGQRSRRLRIAYTSFRRLHRPRHQRVVSVCRGGLDPIDILAPLLAGISLQPTCSDVIQVDILGAELAALSLQPTDSDEVDCDVLSAGLAALSLQLELDDHDTSLPLTKRNRDEFEEDIAAINVDARPYKRVRFTTAPRPGRVPHSSWIAARRRLLLIWSRVAVPLPATVAVPPSVVPIPIISPTPNVVVSAPAVLQNCTNTFVSGTGPNANDIKVGRKNESRSGGAGSVKRTKKTPSVRENAAPFPVSCKTAYLARGICWMVAILLLVTIFKLGSFFILSLFLYMWGPMPPLLDPSPPSSSSMDCFHLFLSSPSLEYRRSGPMSLENAALGNTHPIAGTDDNLLACLDGRPRCPVFTDLAAHAASPIPRIGNAPPLTPTPIGDLAAPVFTQHYPSILHRAGLRLPLLKSVTRRSPPSAPHSSALTPAQNYTSTQWRSRRGELLFNYWGTPYYACIVSGSSSVLPRLHHTSTTRAICINYSSVFLPLIWHASTICGAICINYASVFLYVVSRHTDPPFLVSLLQQIFTLTRYYVKSILHLGDCINSFPVSLSSSISLVSRASLSGSALSAFLPRLAAFALCCPQAFTLSRSILGLGLLSDCNCARHPHDLSYAPQIKLAQFGNTNQ
ncbi:hypothetical protein K438DRAFT_1778333 [Mycena galopus ATCC 62051]|nr:hypothetical protein K438DRAFT_1778333 [Mycena galopus ATCC 62051]